MFFDIARFIPDFVVNVHVEMWLNVIFRKQQYFLTLNVSEQEKHYITKTCPWNILQYFTAIRMIII